MMYDTSNEVQIDSVYILNYFGSLVNRFFKILPMRESGEESLVEYIKSFQRELVGCGGFIPAVKDDGTYVEILCILQFLSDNIYNHDCDYQNIRREVFHGISLCNKMQSRFMNGGECK